MSKIKKLDSYALLIIALSAVVVSIWQVNLTRDYNRKVLQPYVKFDSFENDDVTEISFTVQNKGEGAAIVTNFQITVNDLEYDSWQEAFASIDTTITVPQTASMGRSIVIAAGEVIKMCTIARDSGNFNYAITLSIEFESVYEEPGKETVTFSRTMTVD